MTGPAGQSIHLVLNWEFKMKHTFSKSMTLMGVALALGGTALSTPAFADTLKVAWSQDATGLDPHKQTAFSSIRFLELMYEPLVRLDENADIAPQIAVSWAFNADATELTMKLDPNAKTYWHERSGKRPAASYFKLY